MSYQIEARKVSGVVREANAAIEGKGFNHGEVILGLAELLGRVIVESCTSPQQIDDMKDVVTSHLDRTVSIGSHATGKSAIAQG